MEQLRQRFSTEMLKTIASEKFNPYFGVAVGWVMSLLGQSITANDQDRVLQALDQLSNQVNELSNRVNDLRVQLTAELKNLNYNVSLASLQDLVSNLTSAQSKVDNAAKHISSPEAVASYRSTFMSIVKNNVLVRDTLLYHVLTGASGFQSLIKLWSQAVAARHPLLTSADYAAVNQQFGWTQLMSLMQFEILAEYYHANNDPPPVLQDLAQAYTSQTAAYRALLLPELPQYLVADTQQNLIWNSLILRSGDLTRDTDPQRLVDDVQSKSVPAFSLRGGGTGWRLPTIDQLKGLVQGWRGTPLDWLRQSSGGGDRWSLVSDPGDLVWSSTTDRKEVQFEKLQRGVGGKWYYATYYYTAYDHQLLNLKTGKVETCTTYGRTRSGDPLGKLGRSCTAGLLVVRGGGQGQYYW